MKEKPIISDRAAGKPGSRELETLPYLPEDVRGACKRAAAACDRAFRNRQARTDAAVRTMPGLHDFGN